MSIPTHKHNERKKDMYTFVRVFMSYLRYLCFFVGELMSYLRYLCLFVGVFISYLRYLCLFVFLFHTNNKNKRFIFNGRFRGC
jgi:ABC-type multidrug transport system permease subunit